jgi:acetylornithine deacetylase
MRIPAFDPKLAGGRMYGRGSCDTKAGMAALLAALERVLAAGSLRRNVIVVGEADEEMGSQGVRDVLQGLDGRRPDWVLATEPTKLELVTRHKGRLTLELSAQGQACHASDPDAGHNAIVTMARATLALAELHMRLRRSRDASLGPGTLAVTIASGGQAPNIVPDRAHVIVDRRMLPSESVESVQMEILAALREAGVGERVRIETCSLDKDPLETRDDAACVRHCQAALARCALPTATTVAAFGTDAGPFASAGLPGVVLGPGSIEQAHTADEWVDTAQVDTMTDVLVALLEGDPRASHLAPMS